MCNPRTVLILYSDPSREKLIKNSNPENSSLRFLLHKVNPKRGVRPQLRGIWQKINGAPWPIKGITGTNDLASVLAAKISQEMGLNGPAFQAIYQAQHKALFSQHAATANAHYPTTKLLSSSSNIPQEESRYPGFIKPVAGSLSYAAFEVENPDQAVEKYAHVANQQRADVSWRNELFKPIIHPKDPVLSAFLFQPLLPWPQYTADGYVFDGNIYWVGITASVFDEAGHSFTRFDFPANLLEDTVNELKQDSETVIEHIGYDNACFNIEFFVSPERHIAFIEFNTRQSFQFVPLFTAKYANNYFFESCRLALGEKPDLEPVSNPQKACSCVLRLYEDTEVLSIPSRADCQAIIDAGLAHSIRLMAQPGHRLSDYKQDEYSFRYAIINIIEDNKKDISKKLAIIKKRLTFSFSA